MAARAVASATISFGLVSIPIKFYTAAASEQVHFNMIDQRTGSRVKMQYVSAGDGEVVERDATLKGYEYARGQYVTFTDEELDALLADRKNSIEITEFVPIDSIDFVYVERSYYLGPDKGGDRAYQLLADCMHESSRVAVGQWASRGKEQLVLLRPYTDHGLILHQLYYANEVRSFEEIDSGANFTFSDVERDLARKLIDQLSVDAFDPTKYRDAYAERVRAAVDQKIGGQEITVAPEAPKAQVIDLFEALRRSLAEPAPARAKARAQADEAPRADKLRKASAEPRHGAEPRPVKKAPAPRKARRKTG